jgi:menaquinone-specific isochorismate synthase
MDLSLKIATQIKHFFKYYPLVPSEMEGKILRIEVQLPSLEPLSWLARQTSDVKTYWSDRHGSFTMAGIGTTSIVAGDLPIDYATIFGQLRSGLSALFPTVRYYGGISFRQHRSIDPNWKLFGTYRFVIPRFEIRTDENNTFFACNFTGNFSGELRAERWERELELILDELAQIDFSQAQSRSGAGQIDRIEPMLHQRVDKPNRLDWQRNIDLALAKFSKLNLDKVVLARQTILTFSTNLQPQLLLLLLKPNNPHSYHFCFQVNPTTAFIGTSPERLYYRQDRLLKTEAIAGTRQRGESAILDRELSERLRNSPKDLHEHQLVVNHLRGILAELCHDVTIDRELEILKLNKVQHLYTQCHGTLKADLNDADILPQLHPTPAVGGFPRTPALQLIQELEPFERGWYAAPVGWVGYDDAEFAVAIRSGSIDRDRLLLFAGAGIVRGSRSDEEWAEIENKIHHFTELFTEISLPQIADLSIEFI